MSLWSAFILLLHLFGELSAATKDFESISYIDPVEKKIFQQEGVSTYSQFLFDVARQQVIVGARDNLYRLTLDTLTPLEQVVWPSNNDDITKCLKIWSSEDCYNYIKVLLSNGTSLFACGTNAFNPVCSWRKIKKIGKVISSLSGIAICPYSPHSNVTALLSREVSGGIFGGTPMDSSGTNTVIYRRFESSYLKLPDNSNDWLYYNSQFVGSFETENYVYFLFREQAVENNCQKVVYSRIARVCKYDPGSGVYLKQSWTTFSKARLTCSLPGEFPFYYDEIQGAVYQSEQKVVYATFTTSNNGIAGSAICSFDMSAIEAVFYGPFKGRLNIQSKTFWLKKKNHLKHQQCNSNLLMSGRLEEMSVNQKYQLMYETVKARTPKPLYTADLERFTHVAVDVTSMKSDNVTVLYVATSDRLIKKILICPNTTQTNPVEILGPLPTTVLVMQYLKETESLYVGTQNAFIKYTMNRSNKCKNENKIKNKIKYQKKIKL